MSAAFFVITIQDGNRQATRTGTHNGSVGRERFNCIYEEAMALNNMVNAIVLFYYIEEIST